MVWMPVLHVVLTSVVLSGLGGLAAAEGVTCVMVGSGSHDLQRTLGELGISAVEVGTLGEVPSEADAILVVGESYPQPRQLTDGECERLEALAASGGRVFVEFARPPAGRTLFGCSLEAEVRRALYERLVVVAPLGALQPGDLLEEHDGATLSFAEVPAQAQTLLEYDRALGTYSRIPRPEAGVYTVTVDLGRPVSLFSASQRYGAGQPNYYPESVELWVSTDGVQFELAGRVAEETMPETVTVPLGGQRVRALRFVCRKLRRSPVTDFFFMGEVEAWDTEGRNVALHKEYTLASPHPQARGYEDNGRKLTDGIIEGLYLDGLSVGWPTPVPSGDAPTPALVRVPWGGGEALLSAARLSDFRRRNFRLTRRWEELWRQLVLDLLPPGERELAAARYVPLEAYTEPRVWAPPGTPVRLVVRTVPGARITITSRRRTVLVPVSVEPGRYEAPFTAEAGQESFSVVAETETGRASVVVPFDCRPRVEKYRQALERNVAWFTNAGVLPEPDGSQGVYSQVCMAWLDSQPPDYDFLGSPFRVDCNAMTAEALYLYGLVSGEQSFMRVARAIADTVVAHQYQDVDRASLGGFPWLYEGNETIFFWDDNSRIGNALLWLYHWTGEERYLRSALLGGELFRQVARDDACVHRHAIHRSELDRIGREAYREFSQGVDPDFRLVHWWNLAAVTGDSTYRRLAETCLDIWGGYAGMEGLAHAAYYAPDPRLTERLRDMAAAYLASPSVQRYGATTVGGGGYEAAFVGDCGIATEDGEPLTDQLYVTPWQFRAAVKAWRATGDETCRAMAEGVGDFLVRIQTRHPDPRLDGCWMRGFDVEQWETYGAPYDPAYGPYSAYTGWMNAVASAAFAHYLLPEAPFIPAGSHAGAAQVLQEVRALSPPLVSEGANLALGCPYRLSIPGASGYDDDGRKLTDGVVDGPYEDRRSVGWNIPQVGQVLEVVMDLDLLRPQAVQLITQQYGAGQGGYNPDKVRVLGSLDGTTCEELGTREYGTEGAALLWLRLAEPKVVRYLRFELRKERRSWNTDFLFVGETKAY